jgi:hypothetical protein
MAFEISYESSYDRLDQDKFLVRFDDVAVSKLMDNYEDIKWQFEMMQQFVLDNLAEITSMNMV